MLCQNCGKQNDGGQNYCRACGAPMPQPQQQRGDETRRPPKPYGWASPSSSLHGVVPDFLRSESNDAPPQVRPVAEPPLYQPPVKMPQPQSVKSGCPYCGTHSPPYLQSRISESGWIMFVVMMMFCFPLFWIGLLMRENYRVCSNCRGQLG